MKNKPNATGDVQVTSGPIVGQDLNRQARPVMTQNWNSRSILQNTRDMGRDRSPLNDKGNGDWTTMKYCRYVFKKSDSIQESKSGILNRVKHWLYILKSSSTLNWIREINTKMLKVTQRSIFMSIDVPIIFFHIFLSVNTDTLLHDALCKSDASVKLRQLSLFVFLSFHF